MSHGSSVFFITQQDFKYFSSKLYKIRAQRFGLTLKFFSSKFWTFTISSSTQYPCAFRKS